MSIQGVCDTAGCPLYGVEENTYVLALILTYCTESACRGCPLAAPGVRRMLPEDARSAVREGAAYAMENGFSELRIRFCGGDSFQNLPALQAALEEAETVSAIPVRAYATLCRAPLSQETRAWIRAHKKLCGIVFRCAGEPGEALRGSEPVILHPVTDTVVYCVTRASIADLCEALIPFYKMKKHVRLEYRGLSAWTREDLQRFAQEMIRLFVWHKNRFGCLPPALAQAPVSCIRADGVRRIRVVDTNRAHYPCLLCSPERALFSYIREHKNAFEKTQPGCCAAPFSAAGLQLDRFFRDLYTKMQ